jgi:uncharacterized protein (DUF488 family)
VEKSKIYTIGFTKKSLEKFITLLKKAGIAKIIDIRLNNTSQLAGFAKGKDLEFLLKEGFGINYEHMPIFAPTQEILDSYKKDKDWDKYQNRYLHLLKKKNILKVKERLIDKNNTICLLCSEDSAEKCHRRLLAEYLRNNIESKLEIIHL